MNSLVVFFLIFIASALLLLALLWFYGIIEPRRFLSYGFPEAWREYLEIANIEYHSYDSNMKEQYEKKILKLMGQIDFETDLEHFGIQDKITAVAWLIQHQKSVKTVFGSHFQNTHIENQCLNFKISKKNEEP